MELAIQLAMGLTASGVVQTSSSLLSICAGFSPANADDGIKTTMAVDMASDSLVADCAQALLLDAILCTGR